MAGKSVKELKDALEAEGAELDKQRANLERAMVQISSRQMEVRGAYKLVLQMEAEEAVPEAEEAKAAAKASGGPKPLGEPGGKKTP